MPAYRIVYVRDETKSPETVTATFRDLDQALDVFAERGQRILYIAETDVGPSKQVSIALRGTDEPPRRRSQFFPLRRFSARVLA